MSLARTAGQLQLFISWELDEWALLLLPLVLFLPSRQLWLGIAIGFPLMILYAKLKRKKPAGFIVHFLARNGIISFKKLPPPYISEFNS